MNLSNLLKIAVENLSGITSIEKPDFRLEEAEYDSSDKTWNIVVSYLVDNANRKTSPIVKLSPSFEYYRIYKKVKIDDSGKMIGFYMYDKK